MTPEARAFHLARAGEHLDQSAQAGAAGNELGAIAHLDQGLEHLKPLVNEGKAIAHHVIMDRRAQGIEERSR